jgi:hypothetical protein
VSGVVVRLVAGGYETKLGGDEPPIVPAQPVVLSVSGARTRDVTLDGKRRRLSGGDTGLLAIDLTRSTGFHRLEVEATEYWFGTRDAKLGIDGLSRMLAELDTLGTGWTGQVMFSNGTGIRDPHVSYGWVDQWAERALRSVGMILEAPRSESSTTRVLRRRGGSGVLFAPTLRLLRSDPTRYLADAPNGIIRDGERTLEPLRVVAKKRQATLNTPANRRAVAVLYWIARLCGDVVEASTDSNAVARARLWSNRAQAMMLRPLAIAIGPVQLPSEGRQPEETTDAPYRSTYAIARDLAVKFGWSASIQPRNRLSYVQQSDEIYQAYVASRLAEVMGIRQTSSVLGETQPAFLGDKHEIYYDTAPPKDILRSWRFHSHTPDDSRPDLLVVDRDTKRIAMVDAKYRIGPGGRASEDSRKDVSAYMALYALRTIAIAYPGRNAQIHVVEGKGLRIIELPISPDVPNVAPHRDALFSMFQEPVY